MPPHEFGPSGSTARERSKSPLVASPSMQRPDKVQRVDISAPVPPLPGVPPSPLHVEPTVVDRVLAAIAALTAEVQGMRLEAATKVDLAELRQSMSKEVRAVVGDAVNPLKEEIHSLRTRVSTLESIGVPSSSSTPLSSDVKALLDNLDPAHIQMVFGGISENFCQAERRKIILFVISALSTRDRRITGKSRGCFMWNIMQWMTHGWR